MKNRVCDLCLLMLLVLFCNYNFDSATASESVFISENNYTKRYNLDFANFQDSVTTWRRFLCKSNTKVDSSIVYNGKHPFVIYAFREGIHLLNYHIIQQIRLPEGEFKTIEVRLTSKMKNIERANLWIDHISEDEKIICTDTVDINSTDEEWHTFSHKLSSKGMKYLGLLFLVNSKSKQEKMVWVDGIQVFLDGKPIDSFPLQDAPPFALKNPENVAELSSDEDRFSAIPELSSKKIVALGETAHGSASINKAATQIIRHHIEKNNCKLVLLEFPFELMLSVDKSMNGEPFFAGDSLLKSVRPYYDEEALGDLIRYIIAYNKQHADDPVTLMGMDVSPSFEDNHKYVKHYIKCLNVKIKSAELNKLCDYFEENIPPFSFEVLTYMENHPELKQLIPPSDYAAIIHSLKMSEMASPVVEIRLDFRDFVMSKNATFLLDKFAPGDKRAIIYTHFNHANYGTINYSVRKPILGSYMKDEYKDAYSCLGVFLGNGNILAMTEKDPECTKRIFSPKENSMEFCFDALPESYFYCSSDNFGDMPSYIRLLGVPYMEKEQFYLINPKARMDGAIFIKDSEAVVREK